MPSVKLTDKFVANLKVPKPAKGGPRQLRYFDAGIGQTGLALILLVSYGGKKSWFVGTYVDGIATRPDKETGERKTVKVRKLRTVKLGSYDDGMSLKAARDAARAYHADPKRFEQQATVGSFAEITEKWFKKHVVGGRLRSRYEIERQLKKYILPVWAAKPFLEIRRREVNNLLDVIAEQNGPAQADACLATIRLIMQWWQVQDDGYTSPIVKGMNRNKPQARERILNDAEIARLWRTCDESGSYGAFIKLALLTAQRREKVATMRWDDLIDGGGTWKIRSEEDEKNNAGTLKLPKLALDIIKAQPKVYGNPHVFPGIGDGPFANFAVEKARLDQILKAQEEGPMEPWVVHDLRRTARSLLSGLVSFDHAERVLGHAIKGVAKVYDRHAYVQEKAHALSKLAGLIDTIINPPTGNVIDMQSRKTRPKKRSMREAKR
jgi:integrase